MLTASDWMHARPWLDVPEPDIEGYVQSLRADPGYDLAQKLMQWHREGYARFEAAADCKLIDELQADIEHLLAHSDEYELLVEIAGAQMPIQEVAAERLRDPSVKLNSIHTLSLAAAELTLTKVVVDFLGHVFRDRPVALQTLTFFRGSQQPAHMDYAYVRQQTKLPHLAASWIALEDVHPESGPLVYYPGSHRVDVCDFFDFGAGSIVLEPDSNRTPADFADFLYGTLERAGIAGRKFCAKRGDVFIWHSRLVHEGSPIRDTARSRQSYVTHYTSRQGYPPLHKKLDAEQTGAGVFLNGGFVFDYPWVMSNKRLPSYARRASRIAYTTVTGT